MSMSEKYFFWFMYAFAAEAVVFGVIIFLYSNGLQSSIML